jgi:GTP:adenosylcobinamide-phosphate guanylyltransferase
VAKAYQAIILAAGRGPDDPMAKAYGVSHKCTLPVGGVPMLKRVVDALRMSQSISAISISIEDPAIVEMALVEKKPDIEIVRSENSAPLSAIAAIAKKPTYPFLITTADHALLTPTMVDYFCKQASVNGADFSAGLATAEIILAAYPQSIRTFFRLGKDRVSGCNLFAVQTEKGLRILERWRYLESVRKKPWRLVAAFGPVALIRFALGTLSLESAFHTISQRLGMVIKPVLMPFAEAAIDVDKPADLDLAEKILSKEN